MNLTVSNIDFSIDSTAGNNLAFHRQIFLKIMFTNDFILDFVAVNSLTFHRQIYLSAYKKKKSKEMKEFKNQRLSISIVQKAGETFI